ncbi:unnamed protein product, partial [Prorocentrum cordatum]
DGEALLSRWTRERALESAQRSGGSAYQTPQHGAHFQTPRYSDSTAAAHSLCSSVARASPEGAGSTLLGCAEQEIDRAAALSEDPPGGSAGVRIDSGVDAFGTIPCGLS